MKQLFEAPLGSDGSVAMKIDGGMIKAEVGYKLEAVLHPLKAGVVDKLKAAIPGQIDDAIIDSLWDALIAAVAE